MLRPQVSKIFTNVYPDSCQDKLYGDHDLVVMTPISQIDNFLGFPGFAKGKP